MNTLIVIYIKFNLIELYDEQKFDSTIKTIAKLSEEIKTLDKDDSVNKWYSLKDLDKLNIKPDIIKEIYSTKRTRHDIVKSD